LDFGPHHRFPEKQGHLTRNGTRVLEKKGKFHRAKRQAKNSTYCSLGFPFGEFFQPLVVARLTYELLVPLGWSLSSPRVWGGGRAPLIFSFHAVFKKRPGSFNFWGHYFRGKVSFFVGNRGFFRVLFFRCGGKKRPSFSLFVSNPGFNRGSGAPISKQSWLLRQFTPPPVRIVGCTHSRGRGERAPLRQWRERRPLFVCRIRGGGYILYSTATKPRSH